jgi:ribosome-associated translation inhibitor RaiA
MTAPLQITFHGVDRTNTLEDYVRTRAEKLAPYNRIVTCHVAIEAPHRHKLHGRHYRVRVALMIAGAEIVVDRCPDENRTYDDLYASIDLAFDHVLRRVRDATQRRHSYPGRSRSSAL